jgi:hypothetical protein
MQKSYLLFRLNLKEWSNLGQAALAAMSGLLLIYFIRGGFSSDHLGNDFSQFYLALHDLEHGANPYLVTGPDRVAFNMPLWLLLPYFWINLWPMSTASIVWMVVSLVFIVGLSLLVTKLLKFDIPIWGWPTLLLITLIVCGQGWIVGQPTLLIALFLYLGLLLLERQQPFLAGLSSFIFLCFKPQLTIIVVISLIVWCYHPKLRRFWLGAALALVIAMSLTLLLIPLWPYDYLTTFSIDSTGTYKWATTTLLDWLHYSWQVVSLPAAIIYILWLITGLGTISWFFYQAWQDYLELAELMAVVLAIWLAITPYTRDYDYPLLLLPVLYIFAQTWRLLTKRSIQLVTASILILGLIYYVRGGWMYEFFVFNLLICVLAVWQGWRQIQLNINKNK